MKKIKDFVFANIQAKLQLIFMITVFFLPLSYVWFGKGIEVKIDGEIQSVVKIAAKGLSDEVAAVLTGIVLMGILCLCLRKENNKTMFNKGNEYKYGSMTWYRFCSGILGYRKCILMRVPIGRQFQLVLEDTFDEYVCGEFERNDNVAIEVKWLSSLTNYGGQEINLMIADTYELKKTQICANNSLPTLLIGRKNARDFKKRWYTPKLIDEVMDAMNNMRDDITTIHLYATTNPQHTKEIVEKVFKKAGRGNIRKICVYQQRDKGRREFKTKGTEIEV